MNEHNQFNQIVGHRIENWMPKKLPSKEKMEGKYCRLEPINIDLHAPQLFEVFQLNNQGETWTYLPYGPFDTSNEFENWLRSVEAESDTVLYVIVNLNTEQIVGLCGYLRINPEHGTIEVGHLHFSKLLQKTPAATEAMFLMMHHVFDELHYRRYEWKCNVLNQPSRTAAERLGFTFEGTFRQCNVFKGYNRDTAWYSIIDSEWPTLKLKFQRWFDPSNFDHNGNQKLSLQSL